MKLPPIIHRLSAAAPVASLAALLALGAWLPNRVQIDERTEFRKAQIAAALENVPFFIGSWIGSDRLDEVPPEAQKLLRPNAIFSREYRRPGAAPLRVLIVHCSDARDMIGHYPPVCYPSAGWTRLPDPDHAEALVDAGGWSIPVRTYRFQGIPDQGGEVRIRIFNAFVLPDGNVTRDISDINRQSERLAVSALGVAQFQVICADTLSREEALQAAEEVLGGMGELFETLGVGRGGSP